MIDLSIIIVSYNTEKLLKECIESIVHSVEKIEYEIIVVDNNSTDGSVELIQSSKFPLRREASKVENQSLKLKVIKNDQNLGFSKANNIGVKHSNGKYVLFLNSDTVVYPNTIETMVNFVDNSLEIGAATCKLVMPNGKLDDASHRGFPTPWNSFCHFSGLGKMFGKTQLFNGYNLGWKNIDKIHEIDALAGAFMMVRREAGEQVDWWDEDYFWYGEDLDFCYRLKKKGWKIFYNPNVSILHYKGVSGGLKKESKELTTASSVTKAMAAKARFEAMRIFYKKHYKNIYPWYVNLLVQNGINLTQKIVG